MEEQDQPIQEEQAQDQRIVPFQGDDLATALTANGGIFVSIPSICAALGLSVRGQVQRIQRTDELLPGLRRIPIKTRGGTQPVNCLRIDKIGLWLAGIETARIKGEYRHKLNAYHHDLAPIATQVFLRVAGMSDVQLAPVVDPRLSSMLDQFDTLIGVALDVRAHMEAMSALPEQIDAMRWQLDQAMELLESIVSDNNVANLALEKIKAKTAGLMPAQARQVQEQISHMVAVTEGTPAALKHATIYGRIRHRFRVPSYSNVPDNRFEELMQFLRDDLQRATNGQAPEQGSIF